MPTQIAELLKKYWDIIQEEVNVKQIELLPDSLKITKIYKPIWSQISSKFAKDTGKIIQFSKQWNIQELEDWKIKVFDDQKNERTLEKEDYEIAYQWLDWNNIAVDGNIIAKLDLEITPQLQKEWTVREISRFLNQMRKDADYNVDAKVTMMYETQDDNLSNIIQEFWDSLKWEALLKEIIKDNKKPQWDVFALFNNEESTINFALKK
jgi:isoleucyl-tRNA synthetase